MQRPLLGSARNAPPYFAGRRRELDVLHETMTYIRSSGDPTGGMVLIDGVQGIGKSQLLRRFAAALAESETAVLHATTSSLANELALFVRIVTAIGGNDSMAGQMAAATASAKVGSPLNLPIVDMLARSKRSGLWRGRALLVAVDEIQTVTAADRQTLRALHEGVHECPIMLVGAGLQHSAAQLAAPMALADGTVDAGGISRFAHRLTLGLLQRDETMQAIVLGLDALGHRIGEEQAAALAAASMDFPQHIHGYLAGALEAAEMHGSLESTAALADALQHGHRERVDYYNGRLDSMSVENKQRCLMALTRCMVESGVDRVDWEEAKAAMGTDNAKAVLDDAVARGVLTKDALANVSFGIPSFRQYMAEKLTEFDQSRAAPRSPLRARTPC